MNSPAVSPDRGSTLVLIDDGSSSSAERPATSQVMATRAAQSSATASLRPGLPPSSTHPPDPLLYGLQTMEWRPWLRSIPGSSSSVDEYAKSPAANDDYSNYPTKAKDTRLEHGHCALDMHGVGSCRHSLHWWGKLFWTLLLLASTAGLSYQLYKTVREFWWSGSITGSYTIEQTPVGGSIQFPDVYVCPTNPINETHRRRQRTDTRWYQMLSALQMKSNPEGILGKQFVNWDYFTQPSSAVTNPPLSNFSGSPWLRSDQQMNPSSMLEDLPPIGPTPSPLNIDFMREYFMHNGYDMDAFLVECAFGSKSFKCSDLAQPILDRRHGKCFLFPFSSGNWAWPNSVTAFSSPGTANGSWRVATAGDGFSVAMNIHTELYPRENGSLHDGAYLYIDWRNDPASSFHRKPILLSPGAYSTISIEPREIRMRKLYSHCYEAETEDRKDRPSWMVLNSPQYYREDLCRFDCMLQSLIDTCRCILLIDGRYINRSALIIEQRYSNETDQSTSSSNWASVGYCTAEQLTGCVYDVLQQHDSPNINEYNTNNCTRRCRPSCRLTEYPLVSNTYLKLPAESYLGSGPNYPYPWNELKNNYIILDIVLDRSRTTIIEQATSMNLETFLGIIGGQMSFFLGCSLLTIVQMIVLFLSCCKSQCQRVYRGKCLTVRKTLRKMRHSSLLK